MDVVPQILDALPPLHTSRLKIKPRKFQDLQELKSVLCRDYHDFYNNLPQ
jgi:hypothetical protein